MPVEIRQLKYLNSIVDQDHRAVTRITKLMLGLKSFRAASNLLAGIELKHMICIGQMIAMKVQRSFADQFNELAGKLCPVPLRA
ncbi:MAG: hypothetical protein ACYCTW_08470 [Sulfuricella sp.]